MIRILTLMFLAMGLGLASGGECSQQQMLSIMGSGEVACVPRPALVRLQGPEDQTEVLAPSHVEVMRCSGSCPLAHFSCLASSVRQGPTEPLCSTLEVEEHTSCQCGCRIGPKDCPSQDRHTFLPYECRCACRQEEGRGACLARGWAWDPASCSCICPGRPYPACPSGYVYDYQTGCSCIPIHVMGFAELEVLLVLLGGSGLVALLSLAQCYRNRRVGLARDGEFRRALDNLNSRFDQSIRLKKVDSGDSLEERDLVARQTRGASL